MLGAIAGDIIGSVYEWSPNKSKNFPLFQAKSCFTDDTVLTVAVAESLLSGVGYAESLRNYARRYPSAGYGGMFQRWAFNGSMGPYNSFGNGSAMRVSPVGWAMEDIEAVLSEAARSAEVTHNHPEGIKGARATALALFLARKGADKAEIRREIERRFGYFLRTTVDELRPGSSFDVTCQGSVPSALVSFFDSVDFEDCIRNAISLGADSDTLAAIAGGIAEAHYGGVPEAIREGVFHRLDGNLAEVTRTFRRRFS